MRLKKLLFSRKGDGYIDVVVSVLVSMMLIVLALNVFTFLTIKQDLDYFAKEMISAAAAEGKTSDEVEIRYSELEIETGLSPSYTWEADYYNPSMKTVQLGNTIKLTLTYHTYMEGFGVFRIPVTLTEKHSGLSQKYWKDGG